MARNTKYQREIEGMEMLGTIARSYAEISAVRMQKTRSGVLENRKFVFGMEEVFRQTYWSYLEKEGRKKRRKGEPLTFLSHNGKVVSVLISANAGLYGDVVRRTFDLFSLDFEKSNSEATIIGRLGKALFLQRFPGRPHTYFDLEDWGEAKIGEIVSHIIQYKEVNVYYGSFKTIVSQEAVRFNVSREIKLEQEQEKQAVRHIFEPSIEDVLKFFEGETFASTFDQIVKESRLAKLASRAFSMDRAEQTIEKEVEKVKLLALKDVHKRRNRKQLGFLANAIRR